MYATILALYPGSSPKKWVFFCMRRSLGTRLYYYSMFTLTGHEFEKQLYGRWSWKHGCPKVFHDVWRSILDETGEFQTDVGLIQCLQIFLTLGKMREDGALTEVVEVVDRHTM